MPRPNLSPLIALTERTVSRDSSPMPPLYRQLYVRIRNLILDERFAAGDRLPSSRAMASDLGVSRTTVELAYDQLLAEGFVERRRGAGTFVAAVLPERPVALTDAGLETITPLPTLSENRMLGTGGDEAQAPLGFAPCRPSADLFPIELWNRTVVRTLRERGRSLQTAAPPAGDPALREAVAAHLARTRSVRCSPEQIVITLGTQQALGVLARLLLDPGDAAWIEDPGYLGARAALTAAGARLVPVPVDEDGVDVAAGRRLAPDARLAYVTPSHQYPSGGALNLARRLDLLQWAAQANAWIIEDDYDSEFRHVGRALAPLQSIDRAGQVIYVGTFNKAMFPGLRLGYVVLPRQLADPFAQALDVSAGPVPLMSQAVLGAFIAEGHFASHLRRSGERYRLRREVFLDAFWETFGDSLRLGPSETGLHLCAYVPDGTSDRILSERAGEAGLYTPSLSARYLGSHKQNGLILGYGAVDVTTIRESIGGLARVMGQG